MKKYFLLIISIISFTTIFAQEEYSRPVKDNSKFWDRVYFGGGAGAGFGNITQIQVNPRIGYGVTDRLIAGIGINYFYSRINYDKIYGSGGTFSTSVYGNTLFSSFSILENVAALAEYEALNWEYYDYDVNDYRRSWISSVFVGGSYRQPIGKKGFMELGMLYNLNYQNQKVSPYSSPWVPRVSIYF
jgi:hypothetical protein